MMTVMSVDPAVGPIVDAAIDHRVEPPVHGDERATMLGFLRYQRETLARKCVNLDAAGMANRAAPPSPLTLLGLLRHLAEVERDWFRRIMAGEDAPAFYHDEQDIDGDFDNVAPDPALVDHAWRVWREEIAFADAFVERVTDLGEPSRSPHPRLGIVSLRWVLAHLLEEYARHNGHADLLRERIDGVVGE